MKKITITKELQEKLPDFQMGILSFEAEIYEMKELSNEIESLQNEVKNHYSLADILEIPFIKDARNAYKVLGKDPSRYRLAVESLYRRIVKGNNLYRINNIVDIGNILSLKTKRSIAVLDEDKIEGDVLIRIGTDELYEGIGRGRLNIENIPVYCDDIGPFGSPTSDTERTMITKHTKHILLFIISFSGIRDLQLDIDVTINLYKKYAKGHNFSYDIV